MNRRIIVLTTCLLWLLAMTVLAQSSVPALSGKIISKDEGVVSYATIQLKGTGYGCSTNDKGMYFLYAPPGKYTLVVSAVVMILWNSLSR